MRTRRVYVGAPRAGGALLHHTRYPPRRKCYAIRRHRRGSVRVECAINHERQGRRGPSEGAGHVRTADCTRLNFHAFVRTVPDAPETGPVGACSFRPAVSHVMYSEGLPGRDCSITYFDSF